MDSNNDAGNAAVEAPRAEAPVEANVSSEAGTGTARDSVDRAFAAIDARENESAAAEEPASEKPADTRKRDASGKFAAADVAEEKPAKEAAPELAAEKPAAPANEPADEPPARFTAEAKAVWKDAPPALKGEIKRAFSELEGGINQYREKLAPLDPFIQMATKSGTTLDAALGRYTALEQTLRRDPIAGLEAVCQNLGMSLRDVAAHIMQQTPDQQASQADRTIQELRQHIQQLEQKVGGVSQTIEQQTMAERARQIDAFAADKPRFEELAPTMAQLIQAGVASDLQDAYTKADRLNPAPAPTQAPAQAAQPAPAAAPNNLAAQTRKGSLSVTGAPSSGSNPTNRKPPSSPRDALDRAFNAVGIA